MPKGEAGFSVAVTQEKDKWPTCAAGVKPWMKKVMLPWAPSLDLTVSVSWDGPTLAAAAGTETATVTAADCPPARPELLREELSTTAAAEEELVTVTAKLETGKVPGLVTVAMPERDREELAGMKIVAPEEPSCREEVLRDRVRPRMWKLSWGGEEAEG